MAPETQFLQNFGHKIFSLNFVQNDRSAFGALVFSFLESLALFRYNRIEAATKEDLEITKNGWQTVWNTEFILDPQKEKYAAKTKAGEIIALGAYRVREGSVAV